MEQKQNDDQSRLESKKLPKKSNINEQHAIFTSFVEKKEN